MKPFVIRKIVIALCFLMMLDASVAQDVMLSQFYSSPIYLNPAFAGSSFGYRAVMNLRSHPIPEITNTSAVNASFDGYFPSLSGGLGLVATGDYVGDFVWKNHIGAVYAYHLQLSRSWNVNFGAQAGYYRREIKWDNLIFTDSSQPPPDNTYKGLVNFASGLLAYNEIFYGGVAVHHLTRPNESLFGEERLSHKYTAHVGLHIRPSQVRRANTLPVNYFLSPNIIYQMQEPFSRINLGIYGGIESVMAGVWFRHDFTRNNAVIFLIGLSRDKLNIGYSYDYSLSGFTDTFGGIHEISISYLFSLNYSQIFS